MAVQHLHILRALALHADLYAPEIADESGVPLNSVRAAMSLLRRIGLVKSTRERRVAKTDPYAVHALTARGLKMMRAWFRFEEEVGPEAIRLPMWRRHPRRQR